MVKLVVGTWLMVKLACRSLDIDRDLFLLMWRNQPVVEIFEPGGTRDCRLEAHIDALFPF